MSQHNPISQVSEAQAQPRVVYGQGVNSDVLVDPELVAQTMQHLGIPEIDIAKTTIYLDPKNRFLNNGTEYPGSVGRLRFRGNPEMRGSEGNVIRLTTIKRGEPRPEELMNRTLVHELEHIAQAKRKDPKIFMGYAAMLGLAAAGAYVGNKLGNTTKSKTIGTAVGALVGRFAGYMIAPHEKQARMRAGQVRGVEPPVVSKAVRRK